jgi:hypothetical protein
MDVGSQLDTTNDHKDHQDQLSVSQLPAHGSSPFTKDFNDLLKAMSTKTMLSLMSTQQKNLAKAMWQACNWGGKPLPKDFKAVEDVRDYYELVLMMEHQRQWEEKQFYCKQAKNR